MAPSFLAGQQSLAFAVLRFASVASDASSVASGPSIAIEAAWCGLEYGKRRLIMATIGTFKKTGSNEFTGGIVIPASKPRACASFPTSALRAMQHGDLARDSRFQIV
jgi:hypothetical protein